MTGWSSAQAHDLTEPSEVRLAPGRVDGSIGQARLIWIVRVGDRVFVRSANGPGARWFGQVSASGVAHLRVAGTTHPVRAAAAAADDLPAVDDAYRAKYGPAYSSIVDQLVSDGPRSATLELFPAADA